MAAAALNPWLGIPLADYEAHMALPQVGQAELAYAGLLFEYVDPAAVLRRMAMKLSPDGVLVAALQLQSDEQAEIMPSPYATRLAALAPRTRLVPPDTLARAAFSEGYVAAGADVVTASGGKRLAVQTYRRS